MSNTSQRPLVMFGAGDIAELADYYFSLDHGRSVAAFILDDDFIKEARVMGRPVIARSEAPTDFPPLDTDFFAAVSYAGMNALRRDRVQWARSLGYGIASYVSPRADVFPNVRIGDHSFVLEQNVIQPFVTIGSNVTLWSGNHVGHHSTIDDDVFVASHVVISGRCRIGTGSFLGVNATIRDGVELGARTLVGAGALVLRGADAEAVFPGSGTQVARRTSSEIPRI